ncbi:transforming growth factor-beta-induced protein ig-h3-like protein, partial [Euroglyphus maynei]
QPKQKSDDDDEDSSDRQAPVPPAKKKNGNGKPKGNGRPKSPAAAGRKPQQQQQPQDEQQQEQDYPLEQQRDSEDPFEQRPEDYPSFEPQQRIEPNDPNDFGEMQQLMQKSARQLRCARFVDWLMNSGVIDQILEKAKEFNVTLFAPEDQAVSQLPFNMLNTMQQQPKRNADLMLMHAIPESFEQIYPATRSNFHSPLGEPYQSFSPIQTMQPERQIRFDRSIMPSPLTGQYQPLISGCPLRNSHQIGPIRIVSTGSVLFPPQQSIYSVMKRSPNLRLIREIVDQAQMTIKLSQPDRSYTMFTPTDDAIRKRLSPRQLNSLVRDPNSCRRFVDSHMVANRAIYRSSIPLTPQEMVDPNFQGRQTDVPSCMDHEPLRIRRSAQSFFVNDGHVQYADITTNNGVVHILNDYI